MLKEKRYEEIMTRLERFDEVRIADLSAELDVSEATIRRDIIDMDGAGMLRRVYGGAVSLNNEDEHVQDKEDDMPTKAILHAKEKQTIGRYAASLIEDGDFVFIDAGTTTESMIAMLDNKNATYVTNAPGHGLKLAAAGFNVNLTAGNIKETTEAVIGPLTVESLRMYNFTKAFIGTNGISASRGLTTPDANEAIVKSEALTRAKKVFILADSSKFGKIAPIRFAEIGDGEIITEKDPGEKYRKAARIILAR